MTCVVVARVVFEMCDCHQSIKYDVWLLPGWNMM